MWKLNQSSIVAKLSREGNKIDVGVDGQCDSLGHNATYCTVTAMTIPSNEIIDVEVVNVKEVRNSQGK